MERRARYFGAAAAALVVSGGSLAAIPSPAVAEEFPPGGSGTCGDGEFCGWKNDDKGGGIMDTPYAIDTYVGYDYRNGGFFPVMNDAHSSVWNQFNFSDVRIYHDSGYHGGNECYPRQATDYKNLTDMEDKVSAHKGGQTC